MTVVGATLIAALFILFALYIRADLEELGREQQAADQIGAGATNPRCGMGESGANAAGADTNRPYDREAEDAA